MFVFRTHRCTSRSFTYFSLSLADDRKILKKISVDLFFDLVPTRLIYLRKFLLEINELKWCHFLSPIFLSFGPPYYLLGDKQGKKNGTRTSKPLPGFKKQRNFFEQDRRLPSATELNSVTDDAERRTRIAVCQTASVEATGVVVDRRGKVLATDLVLFVSVAACAIHKLRINLCVRACTSWTWIEMDDFYFKSGDTVSLNSPRQPASIELSLFHGLVTSVRTPNPAPALMRVAPSFYCTLIAFPLSSCDIGAAERHLNPLTVGASPLRRLPATEDDIKKTRRQIDDNLQPPIERTRSFNRFPMASTDGQSIILRFASSATTKWIQPNFRPIGRKWSCSSNSSKWLRWKPGKKKIESTTI